MSLTTVFFFIELCCAGCRAEQEVTQLKEVSEGCGGHGGGGEEGGEEDLSLYF